MAGAGPARGRTLWQGTTTSPSSARQDQELAPTPGLRAIGPRPAAFGARERACAKGGGAVCQNLPIGSRLMQRCRRQISFDTCSSTQIDGNRWRSMAIDGNRWQSISNRWQSGWPIGECQNCNQGKILLYCVFTESQNKLCSLSWTKIEHGTGELVGGCVLRYFFFKLKTQENTISAICMHYNGARTAKGRMRLHFP